MVYRATAQKIQIGKLGPWNRLAKCRNGGCGYVEDLPGRTRDERAIYLADMTHCGLPMAEVSPRELREAQAVVKGFSNAMQPDLPGVSR